MLTLPKFHRMKDKCKRGSKSNVIQVALCPLPHICYPVVYSHLHTVNSGHGVTSHEIVAINSIGVRGWWQTRGVTIASYSQLLSLRVAVGRRIKARVRLGSDSYYHCSKPTMAFHPFRKDTALTSEGYRP